MMCPYCKSNDIRNTDTRATKDGRVMRMRRCLECKKVFRTYEAYIPKGISESELRDLFRTKKKNIIWGDR